jgi:hypothetical protein
MGEDRRREGRTERERERGGGRNPNNIYSSYTYFRITSKVRPSSTISCPP